MDRLDHTALRADNQAAKIALKMVGLLFRQHNHPCASGLNGIKLPYVRCCIGRHSGEQITISFRNHRDTEDLSHVLKIYAGNVKRKDDVIAGDWMKKIPDVNFIRIYFLIG
jgi:hypothetical protein